MKFDLTEKQIGFSLLINSTYEHYKASLCLFKKDFIVAIGGKSSRKCEIYHKSSNKWRTLPDLPEERYGCGAITDDDKDVLYCFGGMNSIKSSFPTGVYKLNLKNSTKWESVQLKEGSLLQKSFFLIGRSSHSVGEGKFIVFGGMNKTSDSTDDIVEIDFNQKMVRNYGFKLPLCARFDNFTLSEFEGKVYFADENENVQVINLKDGRCEVLACFK